MSAPTNADIGAMLAIQGRCPVSNAQVTRLVDQGLAHRHPYKLGLVKLTAAGKAAIGAV